MIDETAKLSILLWLFESSLRNDFKKEGVITF